MKSGFFYGHDFSFWFSVRFHAGESGVCIWFGFWSPASDTVGSKDTRKLWHETRHSCVTPRGSCPALFTPRFQNHAAIDVGCHLITYQDLVDTLSHKADGFPVARLTLSLYVEGEEGVPSCALLKKRPLHHQDQLPIGWGVVDFLTQRGLKPSSFWRFESSLVRSASPNGPKQICRRLLTQKWKSTLCLYLKVFWRRAHIHGKAAQRKTPPNWMYSIDVCLGLSSSFVWAIVCKQPPFWGSLLGKRLYNNFASAWTKIVKSISKLRSKMLTAWRALFYQQRTYFLKWWRLKKIRLCGFTALHYFPFSVGGLMMSC